MKITDVQAHDLRLPDIHARTDSSQDALIVQIDTDAGITGWGEVDGCPSVVKAIRFLFGGMLVQALRSSAKRSNSIGVVGAVSQECRAPFVCGYPSRPGARMPH